MNNECFIIKKIMEQHNGVSQLTGKPWASREFIVERVEDRDYPDELLLKARGERCAEWFGGVNQQFREGDKVMLTYGSRVSSWTPEAKNGKPSKTVWRQENTCWTLEKTE